MVTVIQQNCIDEIAVINSLIAKKVQLDTLDKISMVMALVILWIIANFRGEADSMKNINEQIGHLMKSIGEETEQGRMVKNLLNSLKDDPSGFSEETLDILEKIAASLQHS